jgi:hypothetical protein
VYRFVVEKMKNAAKFLSYPILQYIPITVRTLGSSETGETRMIWKTGSFFSSRMHRRCRALSAVITSRHRFPVSNGELYILILNFQAEIVLFRYLTCKIIGRSTRGSYHVFAITKKYFPRRMLHFVLFENNGVRLMWQNQEIY